MSSFSDPLGTTGCSDPTCPCRQPKAVIVAVKAALDVAQFANQGFRSREVSLVVTKLEEALMWAEKARL